MNRYLVWSLCCILLACNAPELPYQSEGDTLLAKSIELNCRSKHYRQTVDSLWDVVSNRLDQVLPMNMPPGRRENMISIRNAHLLKQFKIFYTTLDTTSLNLISRSGRLDSLMALRVLALKAEQEEQERKVLNFLIKVEKQSQQAVEPWNKIFQQAAKAACR